MLKLRNNARTWQLHTKGIILCPNQGQFVLKAAASIHVFLSLSTASRGIGLGCSKDIKFVTDLENPSVMRELHHSRCWLDV